MSHIEQVKASAGSGKTYEITRRFLQFLAQSPIKAHKPHCGLHSSTAPTTATADPSWGDIMAITFTNLATQEMKDRILKSLKEIALQPPKSDALMRPEVAQAWIETILRGYSALNIRTIDSLLHLIVRTSALSLGFSPDFESSFNLNEIALPVFEMLLEQAEAGDVEMLDAIEKICYSILTHMESGGFNVGNKFEKDLFPLVELLLVEDIPYLSSADEVKEKLESLKKDFFDTGAKLLAISTDEKLNVSANAMKFFIKCRDLDVSALGSAYCYKSCFDDLLNKASKGMASDEAEKIYAVLRETGARLGSAHEVLIAALKSYPFFKLAQRIREQIELLQKKDGKVPNMLMAKYAREILDFEHGVSAALCRLGSSIHHVLLDEFQDTSREQWHALSPLMVEALSCGGSLTFVGDVKQAIYSWRGGDSALFDEVLEDEEFIDKAKPDTKTLPTNWRSKENVVHANNAFFMPLEQEDVAKKILAVLVGKDCPQDVLLAGSNRICASFKGVKQEVKEKDAAGGYVCIDQIGDYTLKSEELEEAVKDSLKAKLSGGLSDRYAWNDIAILVRKRKHATLVAEWLLQWGIPAITENSLLLHTHTIVGESVAFLSFLHCPEDDLAFWSVLTGNMLSCALSVGGCTEASTQMPSLDELHEWRVTQDGKKTPLYKMFKQKWPEFWAKVFSPFTDMANMLTPYECIQEWYRILKISERFPTAETFLRRFLEIVYSAEEQGSGTLGTFLELWEREGKNEKIPTPSNVDAVQILTIHKSKGLQFPVVIIPWMNFEIQDDKTFVVHECESLSLLVPLKKYVGKPYYTTQVKNALESLYVLYVACTRAEEELHLFHTKSQGKKGSKYLSAALDILFEKLELSLPYELGVGKDAVVKVAKTKTLVQKPLNLCPEDFMGVSSRILDWQPRLKIYRQPLRELIRTEIFNEYGLRPNIRGELVHYCLETMQKINFAPKLSTASDVELQEIHQRLQIIVGMGIQNFGMSIHLSRPMLEALVQELSEKLLWCASLPEMDVWFTHALAEQSILNTAEKCAGKVKETPIYRIDLLLPPLKKGDGYKLIDFKTGEIDPEHIRKMQLYIKILDKISQNAPHAMSKCEGMLIYLDHQKCRMVQDDNFSELFSEPRWQGDI